MIFRIILVAALAVLAVYTYFQGRRSPLIALGMLALVALGAGFSINPDLATHIANYVGIGRGADLVIYCFVLISLGAIFNLHIKLRASEDNLTQIVRKIAIMDARLPADDSDSAGRKAPAKTRRGAAS